MRGFRPHVVRDQIRFLLNPARVRRPAVAALSRVQDFTPGEQIVGLAVALRAVCESANISLEDVMAVSANIMRDAEGAHTHHIQAIRDFAANEIRRGEEYRQ